MRGISHVHRDILAAIAAGMREIDARPQPPAWQTWAVREWEEAREYGVRYEPARMFGGGSPLPERIRTRYLRVLHELAEAGLLTRTGTGGRLTHVKLTPTGLEAAAGIAAADQVPAVTPEG